ncbi:MAG: hypothetical protein AB8I08_30855 [Sandaracinaceae bacterium]
MSRKHVDEENLEITGRHRHSQPPGVAVEDNVIIVVTQAFGPKGDNLVGVSDVTYDEHPAVTLDIELPGGEKGPVHLSPIHGDKRKQAFTDIPAGTKLKVFCPVSGEELPKLGEVEDGSGADYYLLYLTPKLEQRASVALSDTWGHYHSRIVDEDELISYWTASNPEG